jgi:HAD superfamily hydrolase (TIGR01484 family)
MQMPVAAEPKMRYLCSVSMTVSPFRPARLLSFDFDGTLHNPAENPPVSPALFALLQELRDTHHAAWGINTGRSLEYLLEGLAESHFPSLPDFIIAREREIFFLASDHTWQADEEWNQRCEREIAQLLLDSADLMKEIRHLVKERTGAEWIEQPGEPAGIIARTETEMAWIVSQIETRVPPTSALGWQRNSIYLRFGDLAFQKGSSLTRVAHCLGIAPAGIFAIGDSHNDLEMLDHGTAAMIACPANSVPEISAHVNAQGGYLCRQSYSEGAVEALRHFFRHPEQAR